MTTSNEIKWPKVLLDVDKLSYCLLLDDFLVGKKDPNDYACINNFIQEKYRSHFIPFYEVMVNNNDTGDFALWLQDDLSLDQIPIVLFSEGIIVIAENIYDWALLWLEVAPLRSLTKEELTQVNKFKKTWSHRFTPKLNWDIEPERLEKKYQEKLTKYHKY